MNILSSLKTCFETQCCNNGNMEEDLENTNNECKYFTQIENSLFSQHSKDLEYEENSSIRNWFSKKFKEYFNW